MHTRGLFLLLFLSPQTHTRATKRSRHTAQTLKNYSTPPSNPQSPAHIPKSLSLYIHLPDEGERGGRGLETSPSLCLQNIGQQRDGRNNHERVITNERQIGDYNKG